MKLIIPHIVLTALQADRCPAALRGKYGYNGVGIAHSRLTPKELTTIREIATLCLEKEKQEHGSASRDAKQIRVLLLQLKRLDALKDLTDSAHRAKSDDLESMRELLLVQVKDLPRPWVFITAEDGTTEAWLITAVEFTAARKERRTYYPATLTVRLMALSRGTRIVQTLTWHPVDVKEPVTVAELLATRSVFIISEELEKEYEEGWRHYQNIRTGETFAQYLAEGVGSRAADEEGHDDVGYSWWRNHEVHVAPGESQGRVILDDEPGYGDSPQMVPKTLGTEDGDDDLDDWATALPEDAVETPLHFKFRAFSLHAKTFIELDAKQLTPYPYDPQLYDKLIMAESVKQLIEVLVLSSARSLDLIKNKGAGTIIIASGPPGVGKTLTAEVFAERAKLPLYPIQCSQLGTDPSALEQQLSRILLQASRWGAILLLDEADVYIRQRGDDLTQNAIVGVFLRLLEYYQGVLFLTTNREDIVDDAILSRCIARVRYTLPTEEERVKLWNLYADAAGLQLTSHFIKKTAAPSIMSGRTIRGLCRLMKTAQACGATVDEQLFQWLCQFQHGAPSNMDVASPLPSKFTTTTPRKRPRSAV